MENIKAKVRMRMIGEDGNAFAILGRFRREARRQGWTAEEMRAVTEEARIGDYYHLLATISENVEDEGDDEE